MKVRLDQLLFARGLAASRTAAQALVLEGKVRVEGRVETKAGRAVAEDAALDVEAPPRFVSRGGEKLEGAFAAFPGWDVAGHVCLDVGSSTGGFTDCLLQAGAASVACVDVNYGQLAMKLRQDARVTAFERTNIRTADPAELGAPFDIIVADLSFIGLAQLAPVFASLGQVGSVFLGLIKPQFESAADESDHGIVRDESVRQRVIGEVEQALRDAGFQVTGVVESAITGAKGNVEYLVRAVLR